MTYHHDSLIVKQLPVGELQANCYLVYEETSKKAIIIDPGDEGDFISEEVIRLGLQPQAIILTHGHFDHVMGLLEVKLNFNIPILIHEADKFLLESLQSRAQHWLKRKVDPAPPANSYLTDNQILLPQSLILNCLYTPGHTPGSICLYNNEIIFTGDTLFKDAIGRTDFSYSSGQEMQKSLQKIFKLNHNLVVYPGHGERTSIKIESTRWK